MNAWISPCTYSCSRAISSAVCPRPHPLPAAMASVSRFYLLFYNAAMCAGWATVLLRLLRAVANNSPAYPAVEVALKVFQTGAVLEVLHSLVGLIRAPASTTALQVTSRLMLVWGICDAVPQTRDLLSFKTMVLAWSLTEIPRYFYFVVGCLSSQVPHWLIFLRYSTFIPLYPLGACSEFVTMLAALPIIHQQNPFSIAMPNPYNFAFDYFSFCVIALISYLPGLPYMYMHMLRQRRKYVGRMSASDKVVKTN